MAHIHGKTLKVGDNIYTYAHGFGKVTLEETDNQNISFQSNKNGKTFLIDLTEHEEVIRVRSWQELAEEAIVVQDACNLIAVANSFSKVVREVRYRLESESQGGSDQISSHPVCVLWASKIASLTNCELGAKFSDAYNWACDIGRVKK